jgi:hypothetical protein
MATSDNTSKRAASSTPAAQPAASQAAVDSDALPSRGAVRGDIYGLKDSLAAELGQLSDGQHDETDSAAPGADAEESANLDQHDEQEAAAAADELAGDDEAGTETEATTDEATAAAADGEGEATGEAAEPEQPAAPSATEGEKPKVPEALQARFNELTARAKGAEEQVAALREQLASYRARDEGSLAPEALDHLDSPEELTAAQKRYSALLSWAIKHPDGGTLGDKEYTAEQVREMHAEAQTLLAEAIPARRGYLEQRVAADRDAVNFYPWLKDTSKGAGAAVSQAIQQIPAIRRLPNHRLIAADAFVGQVLRQNGIAMTDDLLRSLVAAAKAGAKGGKTGSTGQAPARSAAKPPAAPSRAGVLPPRQTPRAAAAKVAQQRVRSGSGSEDELAASIAAKL